MVNRGRWVSAGLKIISALLVALHVISPVAFAEEECRNLLTSGDEMSTSHYLLERIEVVGTERYAVFRVRKRGEWEMNGSHNLFTRDRPGSLTWNFKLIGGAQARILGMKAYDESGEALERGADYDFGERAARIRVPLAETVTARLKNLDRALRREGEAGIPYTFYPAREVVVGEEYLRRLTEKKEWPMGSAGELYSHDLNYHFFPLLLLTPAMIEVAESWNQLLLDFLDFVRGPKSPVPAPSVDSAYVLKLAETLIAERVSGIDLSGNLTVDFLRLGRGLSEEVEAKIFADIGKFLGHEDGLEEASGLERLHWHLGLEEGLRAAGQRRLLNRVFKSFVTNLTADQRRRYGAKRSTLWTNKSKVLELIYGRLTKVRTAALSQPQD